MQNAKTKVTTQGHAKVKEVEVRWKLKIKVVFVLADVICYFWKCFDVKKLMTYGYFGFH